MDKTESATKTTKHMPEEREQSAEKPAKHNKPRNTKLLKIGFIVLAIWLVALLIVHHTKLRFYADPLGTIIDYKTVRLARTDVDKANARLSIAESRLKDFKQLRTDSPGNPKLDIIVADMLNQDKLAMQHMDNAKRDGEDIKKLTLVKRLCDLLGEQERELKNVNSQITPMHNFAATLEDKVAAGQNMQDAIKEIEKNLGAAMHW